MLSAFIVAERVTVLTRAPGHEGLWWESTGGKKYTVDRADRPLVGTTVTLHIRPGHSRYLDRDRLQSIIRTYADVIGVPVYLGNDAEPANAVTAPWHRGHPSARERNAAYTDFWERKFTQERSLHVFASMRPSNGTTSRRRTARAMAECAECWRSPTGAGGGGPGGGGR